MTGSNQHATTMIRGKTNRARGGFIATRIAKKMNLLGKNVKQRLDGNDDALEHSASHDRGLGLSIEPLCARLERAAGRFRRGSGPMPDAFGTGKKETGDASSLLQRLACGRVSGGEERRGRGAA